MKKILLCLILLLCLSLLLRRHQPSPIPDGIRMGMPAEEAAEILCTEPDGSAIVTDDAVYIFGENGLMYVILHKNP